MEIPMIRWRGRPSLIGRTTGAARKQCQIRVVIEIGDEGNLFTCRLSGENRVAQQLSVRLRIAARSVGILFPRVI